MREAGEGQTVEVSSLSDLIEALRALAMAAGAPLIAIDGAPGAGKSTLARALEQELGGRVLSLDDFVKKQQGSWLPHLRTDELAEYIAAHRAELLWVEGVCALAALERAKARCSCLVYVRSVTPMGDWDDEHICDPPQGWEARVKDYTMGGALDEEVMRYSAKYRPLHRAHILYTRVDEDFL